MMDGMLTPIRKYAVFTGRARPREFWLFILFLFVASIAVGIIENLLGLSVARQWTQYGPWHAEAHYYQRGGPLTGLFALAMLIPYLAVAVRRLHDTDRSGWWLLLSVIPFFRLAYTVHLLRQRGDTRRQSLRTRSGRRTGWTK